MTSTLTCHAVTPRARRLLEELRAELVRQGLLVTLDHGDEGPALVGVRRPPPEPPVPAYRTLHVVPDLPGAWQMVTSAAPSVAVRDWP